MITISGLNYEYITNPGMTMKNLLSEIRSLADPELRGCAIRALIWRVAFTLSVVWALPHFLCYLLTELMDRITRATEDFFLWPGGFAMKRWTSAYKEAASIVAIRKYRK